MRYEEKLKRFSECRKTCKNLSNGIICSCLEAILPRDQNQSAGAIILDPNVIDNIDHDIVPQVQKRPKQFKKKLKKYGLDNYRIQCLTLRFVYNYTYEQIAAEIHAPTKWVVFDSIKSALKMLKERGFK